MTWWQIVLAAAGGLAALQAARVTIWRAGRALIQFGDALPEVVKFPETVKALQAEVIGIRTDLADHMVIEDNTQMGVEKVLARVIVQQRNVELKIDQAGHEVANLQQIVMNGLKLGEGDRWRLTHHEAHAEETVMEQIPKSEKPASGT